MRFRLVGATAPPVCKDNRVPWSGCCRGHRMDGRPCYQKGLLFSIGCEVPANFLSFARMMPVLGLAVMLAAFWLLLSGQHAPLFLSFGASSVVLVTVLARRMDIVDHEAQPLALSLRAPAYWIWLTGQVLVSAWDVTRRIWAPRPHLDPALRVVRTDGMSALAQVIYANSITLTPGTLSVKVNDSGIVVHTLDKALLNALYRGVMAARVRRMEPH